MLLSGCLVLCQGAVSAEEMERRAAYLREQRDRIVAMKKAERDAKLAKHRGEQQQPDEKQQHDEEDGAGRLESHTRRSWAEGKPEPHTDA